MNLHQPIQSAENSRGIDGGKRIGCGNRKAIGPVPAEFGRQGAQGIRITASRRTSDKGFRRHSGTFRGKLGGAVPENSHLQRPHLQSAGAISLAVWFALTNQDAACEKQTDKRESRGCATRANFFKLFVHLCQRLPNT
jgi:hypothetical protein